MVTLGPSVLIKMTIGIESVFDQLLWEQTLIHFPIKSNAARRWRAAGYKEIG